jgi:beta-lactamase regulating signal transducer with metallopeptidase domain
MPRHATLGESAPLTEAFQTLTWSESIGYSLMHALWMGGACWVLSQALRHLSRQWKSEIRYLAAVGCLSMQIALLPIAFMLVTSKLLESFAPRLLEIAIEKFSLQLGAAWLTNLWIAGMAVSLSGIALGVWGAARLRTHATLVTAGPWCEYRDRLCREMGISRRVLIAISDRVQLPILIGIVRPCILVPVHFITGWAHDRAELVLMHELVHVRRWDNLITLGQRIAETVLFFQPAVWSISRWVDEEREFCCDDAVLRMTGRHPEYAETLMALAGVPCRGVQPIPASYAGRPPIKARLERILFPEEHAMTSRPLALGTFVAVLMLAGGLLSLVQPAVADEPRQVQVLVTPAGLEAGVTIRSLNGDSAGSFVVSPQVALPAEFTTRAGEAAAELIDFIQIGEASKRSWGPEQVMGPPDTDGAGDIATAWASLSTDDQEEWLILHYERPVEIKLVEIHETYNPGAVVKVTAFNEAGEEVLAWEGEDPTPTTEDRGISIIPTDVEFMSNRIKVYIDSPAVLGWNEIDAVGIHDKNGDVQWAVNVECSTTYADPFSTEIPNAYANYGPEQAAGEPNTLVAGDAVTAWASASSDGQEEWLICHYENMVVPESVAVHETTAPGALFKVSVIKDGVETVVWEGEDPTPVDELQGISVIPIDIDFEVDTVKLYLDSVRVPGWNEIDAVGLRSTGGETQWAMTVEASSTYASGFVYDYGLLPATPYVDPTVMILQQDVEALRGEVESLRGELAEIKALLLDQASEE